MNRLAMECYRRCHPAILRSNNFIAVPHRILHTRSLERLLPIGG